MNLTGFNAEEQEEQRSFDPLPDGKYLVLISKSEERQTKSWNGSYLSLELTVIDGPHQGRKLFDNLNINNANETAAKIARSSLAAICKAVGVMRPSDSSQLHDKPLIANVKSRKREDTGEIQNVVRGYFSANNQEGTSKPQAVKPSAPQPAAAGFSKAPWGK